MSDASKISSTTPAHPLLHGAGDKETDKPTLFWLIGRSEHPRNFRRAHTSTAKNCHGFDAYKDPACKNILEKELNSLQTEETTIYPGHIWTGSGTPPTLVPFTGDYSYEDMYTVVKRISFAEDCDYLAFYCMKAYQTGTLCARSFLFVYHSFPNYCMVDYVNCMEKYEVWQVMHMGECVNLVVGSYYEHATYYDDYFMDLYYLNQPRK